MGYLNSTGLKRLMNRIFSELDSKLDRKAGSANAGKHVVVGSSGNLTLQMPEIAMSMTGEIAESWVDTDNAEDGTYEMEYEDEEEAEFEPGCMYAAEILFFSQTRRMSSNLSFCRYLLGSSLGEQWLFFENYIAIGGIDTRVTWRINITTMEVFSNVLFNGVTHTIMQLFTETGMTDMVFTVYKVQDKAE